MRRLLTIQIPAGDLLQELNKLHGYSEGTVPFGALVPVAHTNAAYRVLGQGTMQVMVDLTVDVAGKITLSFPENPPSVGGAK